MIVTIPPNEVESTHPHPSPNPNPDPDPDPDPDPAPAPDPDPDRTYLVYQVADIITMMDALDCNFDDKV